MLLSQAVGNLVPAGSIWSVRSMDDVWCENEVDVPTKVAIEAEMNRLQAEYDAQEYARNRIEEYPSIQALVVALYDSDDKAAVDEKRAAVKAKYPKPN